MNINGLGNVQPHVRTAAEEIAQLFGIYTMGGFATSGHISDSDHYTGLAIDVPIPNGTVGNKVAEWVIANATRLNVKYVIYNRRIWQNGNWSSYSGTSPHTDHVHISFNSGDGTTQNVGNLSTNSGCIGKLLGMKGTTNA